MRWFPIIDTGRVAGNPGHPEHIPPSILRRIPWDMIEPHEKQALANHQQSLDRLAERGGLSPCEALVVLEDREFEWVPPIEADEKLFALVCAWVAERSKKASTS